IQVPRAFAIRPGSGSARHQRPLRLAAQGLPEAFACRQMWHRSSHRPKRGNPKLSWFNNYTKDEPSGTSRSPGSIRTAQTIADAGLGENVLRLLRVGLDLLPELAHVYP